ncbi:MAG: carboxylating nicotinate-nucleotide diphosphorylase [Armatimonadetes bacterium]|nr:carboxylating nicotinate-nucleotide diphosphorylase [Armatimonadota bacterium]
MDAGRRADPATIREIVRRALAEDIGPGDITSATTVDARARGRGVFLAKQEGVLAGMDVAAECFRQVDETVTFSALAAEGDRFAPGDHLGVVEGPARSLLTAERVALNFLQRLCGVATIARRFADEVAGTGAVIVDTRKTTPGLRALEKAAVLAGGGHNHRFALYDGVLIKDNHIRVAGGVRRAVERARAGAPHSMKIEVETATLDEVQEALDAGADIIMLDNMDLDQTARAVEMIAGRALVEASGGMTIERVRAVAETGVNLISVGRLTHSAPAVDISLELALQTDATQGTSS